MYNFCLKNCFQTIENSLLSRMIRASFFAEIQGTIVCRRKYEIIALIVIPVFRYAMYIFVQISGTNATTGPLSRREHATMRLYTRTIQGKRIEWCKNRVRV